MYQGGKRCKSLFPQSLKYHIQCSTLLGHHQYLFSAGGKIRHQITDQLGFSRSRWPLHYTGFTRSYRFHSFLLTRIYGLSIETIVVSSAHLALIHRKRSREKIFQIGVLSFQERLIVVDQKRGFLGKLTKDSIGFKF